MLSKEDRSLALGMALVWGWNFRTTMQSHIIQKFEWEWVWALIPLVRLAKYGWIYWANSVFERPKPLLSNWDLVFNLIHHVISEIYLRFQYFPLFNQNHFNSLLLIQVNTPLLILQQFPPSFVRALITSQPSCWMLCVIVCLLFGSQPQFCSHSVHKDGYFTNQRKSENICRRKWCLSQDLRDSINKCSLRNCHEQILTWHLLSNCLTQIPESVKLTF
jgi:hypothetical protein